MMDCPNCHATLDRLGPKGFFWCPICGLLRHQIGDADQDRVPAWTKERIERESPENNHGNQS